MELKCINTGVCVEVIAAWNNRKLKQNSFSLRILGNTRMAFFHQHSAPTESSDFPTSSPASVIASSKFYAVPCLESNDSKTHEASQTAVKVRTSISLPLLSRLRGSNRPASMTKNLPFFKAFARSAPVLQRVSEVPKSYSNNNDISDVSVLSNKAKMIDEPLDSSYVKVRSKLDCRVLIYILFK